MTGQRLGAGVFTAVVVLAGPLPAAIAHGDGDDRPPGPRVVADGLDNPRQLNRDQDGNLVVAEAGRGGPECVDARCKGPTAAVTLIEDPHRDAPTVSSAVEGLLSVAAPDGNFAEGPGGADATDVEGQYIVAGYDPAGYDLTVFEARGGSLLAAGTEENGEEYLVPYADLQAAEEELNPDGAQVDSNPYAVLYVDEDDEVSPDGYALVADAGANAVWKIEPDFSTATEDALPEYEITVFASWPTTALPDGSNDPEGPVEFVPTSLAADQDGNVYVGGLGALQPGEASVVQFSADGTELDRWDGFTGITGVAVDRGHLYVSQLFGPTPPPMGEPSAEGAPAEETPAEEAPAEESPADEASAAAGESPADEAPPASGEVLGQVVVLHRHEEDAARYAIDVPLPAGLATGRHGEVYASVNSLATAEGIAAGPMNLFGAAVGGGAVWELDFSDAYRLEAAEE
ncbi:ScyD/ScyE family protein [Kocuria nitroreducens]|uniref:ScyD/ScyE family protein n=1 Tax=Kocuria nitroreducens TaxID=3058914 RepID=UPI0036D84DD4